MSPKAFFDFLTVNAFLTLFQPETFFFGECATCSLRNNTSKQPIARAHTRRPRGCGVCVKTKFPSPRPARIRSGHPIRVRAEKFQPVRDFRTVSTVASRHDVAQSGSERLPEGCESRRGNRKKKRGPDIDAAVIIDRCWPTVRNVPNLRRGTPGIFYERNRKQPQHVDPVRHAGQHQSGD